MKIASSRQHEAKGVRAFTLVETMIVSATLVIIFGSVIACNLFGLSMAARQQIWLSASDDAAQAISTLMGDVRSATSMEIGNETTNGFVQVSSSGPQTGNALLIFTNNSTTLPWTLYYYDSTSNNLVRSNYYGPGVAGDFKLVSANPITNDLTHPIFTETDSSGNTLTIGSPLAPVNIYLSFTKLQDPQIVIESGSSVDLYQINATINPRLRTSL